MLVFIKARSLRSLTCFRLAPTFLLLFCRASELADCRMLTTYPQMSFTATKYGSPPSFAGRSCRHDSVSFINSRVVVLTVRSDIARKKLLRLRICVSSCNERVVLVSCWCGCGWGCSPRAAPWRFEFRVLSRCWGWLLGWSEGIRPRPTPLSRASSRGSP